MQRAVNTAIEENVFSVWFAYIHCWATDVFSMGPPRDYVSSPLVNQKSIVERERECKSPRQAKKKGSAEDCELL
jgi:hypothetical protein